MEIVVVVLGLWALAATAGLFIRKPAPAALPAASSPSASSSPSTSAPARNDDAVVALEKKLADARAEAQGAREKLAARQKELDDLREQAKAKARREGKKDARDGEDPTKAKAADPRDVEIQSLRKGMAGLEAQLNTLKREAAATVASTTDVASKSAAEIDGAKKAADAERERRRSLEDEVGSLKKTIDELRAALKKADARPDVPGTSLNLKELPTPAVQELSRFFRKGEEFERLYTVAQSQLQLEKDRYLELQRRYFAVCRELAVQAGLPANASEADLQKKAESVVDGAASQLAERQARLAGGSSASTSTSSGPAGAAGEAAAAPGDAPKKRRRRRRRKIAGEPSVVEGDAVDGDDEGDDESDAPAAEAASSTPSSGDSGASAPA